MKIGKISTDKLRLSST